MFSNNSPEDATPSVSSLLPEVLDELARVSVVLVNFVADANPSRAVIDEVDARYADENHLFKLLFAARGIELVSLVGDVEHDAARPNEDEVERRT